MKAQGIVRVLCLLSEVNSFVFNINLSIVLKNKFFRMIVRCAMERRVSLKIYTTGWYVYHNEMSI